MDNSFTTCTFIYEIVTIFVVPNFLNGYNQQFTVMHIKHE